MDPNACLKSIRDSINRYATVDGDTFRADEIISIADDIITFFRDLDNWLTEKDGYLPEDWKR